MDKTDRELVARLADTNHGGPGLAELLGQVSQRAEAEGLVEVAWAVTDTPIGPLVLAATPAGVVRIDFGDDENALADDLARRLSPRVLRAPRRLDGLRRELDEYFEGRRQAFEVPLDWRLSHGYRRTVLGELAQSVPFGQVVSYKELSERAGSPKASRATGSAMATNPIPIVVPCHRVVGSNGSLTGYGGGLDTKLWLLRHEGALLA